MRQKQLSIFIIVIVIVIRETSRRRQKTLLIRTGDWQLLAELWRYNSTVNSMDDKFNLTRCSFKTGAFSTRARESLTACLAFARAHNNTFQMEVTHTAQLVTGLAFFAQGIAWTDCCHQSHSFAHHDKQLHSMNIQSKWGLSPYNSVVLAWLLLPIRLPGASLVL